MGCCNLLSSFSMIDLLVCRGQFAYKNYDLYNPINRITIYNNLKISYADGYSMECFLSDPPMERFRWNIESLQDLSADSIPVEVRFGVF